MSLGQMTFQQLRDDLPITGNVAYFQVGSHGPTPDSVLDVVREEMALEAHYHSVPSVKAEQAQREAAARARVASFIGAGADEVALTPNTTQAMRLVSRSIDWKDWRRAADHVARAREHRHPRRGPGEDGWGSCPRGRGRPGRRPVPGEPEVGHHGPDQAAVRKPRGVAGRENPSGRRRRRAGPRARRAGRRRHGAVAWPVPGRRPRPRLRLHGWLRAQVAAGADGHRHPVGLPRRPGRLHARPAARPQALEHAASPRPGPDRVRPRRGRDSQHGDGYRTGQGRGDRGRARHGCHRRQGGRPLPHRSGKRRRGSAASTC